MTMKTIQQYFKEIDINYIIDAYLHKYPIQISNEIDYNYDNSISCEELFLNKFIFLYSTINRIQRAEIKSDDVYVFFIWHCADNSDYEDYNISLLNKSDILNSEFNIHNMWGYSYCLNSIEETAGYFIADTHLTQCHIVDILVEYLYEITWFLESEKENIIKELEEKTEWIKDNDTICLNADKVMKDLNIQIEKRDKEEYEAWKQCNNHILEYNIKSFMIEKQKVAKLLEDCNE